MYLIRAHFKERLAEDFKRGLLMMLTGYLFLVVFIKAYAMDTQMNCPDLSWQLIQMSNHNIYFYKEVDTTTCSVT